MNALNFVATIVLVSASGVLSPGPLFFAAISQGTRVGARSGLVLSIGHTLVEFTLVMLLAVGLLTVANTPNIKLVVGVTGGIVLIAFGIMQIRNSLVSRFGEPKSSGVEFRSLLLTGLAFTGLNPFFIIWWLTVGAELILMSLAFAALAGVVFMYVCHVWMDYAWLTALAHFAKVGTSVAGFKWYRLIMAVFGAILIYFGLTFLFSSLGF
jgi:threonine/homoserine/homoserine lactone efflux protein